MHMKKNILIILFGTLLIPYSIFAQQKIDSSYVEYFENTREVPFLHLNKTSFLLGEEIWFKAYIQEQNTQKLHPTTSNLYVSIFNKNGTLKDQKLVHIKEGTGKGNIAIDSTFTADVYYLKASTKWMKNFEDDNAFYQKIKIITSNKKEKRVTLSEKDFYEFKLFPEGGHFVANTLNNIGILIKNQKNEGVQISKGIIKDENNNTVRHYNTNAFGMNNIRLFLPEEKSYTFHAILDNGVELKANLPKPEARGISLIVNSKNPTKVSINVITNAQTLKAISGKTYRVLVHNTRDYKNFKFQFNEKHLNHALLLEKKELKAGVNIVTVFNDENKPISERILFIKSKDLFDNIEVSNTSDIKNDSLLVKFTGSSQEKSYLSASFLPGTTKAYQPKNNILSTYLLRPYVKGDIQNASKLLGEEYVGQQRDLDLLLLIQGWSKYNWNTIFNSPPKTYFDFENGIDITAQVNQQLSSKQSILLSSKVNNLVRVIKNTENPYKLENSFIKKNSTLNFGLSSNDNFYKIAPALSYSGGKLSDYIDNSKIEITKNTALEVSNFEPLKSAYVDLDEVEVQANKRKKEEEYKVYGYATMFRRGNLDKRVIASGETVLDFLRYNNYPILSDETGNPVILPRGVGQVNPYRTTITRASSSVRPLVRIFLDNDDVSFSTWIVENLYLNSIKEIFFGRNPGGLGEEIHIFTLSPLEYVNKNSKFGEITVPVGFATEKEYYNPIYPSFTDETYKRFGSVFWEPNIHLEKEGEKTIKIPSFFQEVIHVYVEGITESGKLISKKIELKSKK